MQRFLNVTRMCVEIITAIIIFCIGYWYLLISLSNIQTKRCLYVSESCDSTPVFKRYSQSVLMYLNPLG